VSLSTYAVLVNKDATTYSLVQLYCSTVCIGISYEIVTVIYPWRILKC